MPTQIETAAKLYESGDLIKADSLCSQILENDQNNATALHLRGVIAYQSQNYTAAISLLSATNKLIKNNTNIMFALAASYENTQEYEPAITFYRKICDLESNLSQQLTPIHKAARHQLAAVYEKNHQFEKALSEYQCLEKISQNDPNIFLALSRLYAISGDEKNAEKYAQQLISLAPEDPDVWNNLGLIYKTINKIDDAIKCFNKALSINDSHTKSRLNLASILHDKGQYLEAKNNYLHAITDNPSPEISRAYYNLALIYLGSGDFATGWKYLTQRPKKFTDTPSLTDLKNKRLLLIGEEGLGDELTFLRFIPLLKKHAESIDYIGNPKLLPLLKQVTNIDTLYDSLPAKDQYDYCVSAMDLPFILGINAISSIMPLTLSAETLTPDDSLNHPIINEIKNTTQSPILGITWRAGQQTENNNQEKYLDKSIPIKTLASMLKTFAGTIVILQRNPQQDEIEYLKKHTSANIIDASSMNNDLRLMLQTLNHIDHYIGVSNTNMHLFASLGKSCDVIVPFPGEWRWMYEGDSSPWYPKFNILRQIKAGDWENILNQKPVYLTHE